MKRLAILGASGHGKVVADTAECVGWNCIEFFDDAWPDNSCNGAWPIVGSSAELLGRLTDYSGVIVAIGNNLIRARKLRELSDAGASIATLIHPNACVSKYAQVGYGVVVFAGVQVNAYAVIGNAVILNTACSVDHECALADAVHISPGAHLAGGVQVGTCTWIGIGASVRQLISIGKNVVVGAGAAVVSDVPDGFVVAGVPAKRIK